MIVSELFLGFKLEIKREEYKLSDYLVDIISFDNILIECNIGQAMTFKGQRSGIIHTWTMTVYPGYKYVEKFVEVIVGICWKVRTSSQILVWN